MAAPLTNGATRKAVSRSLATAPDTPPSIRRRDGRRDGRRSPEDGLTPAERKFVNALVNTVTDPDDNASLIDCWFIASPSCKTRNSAAVGASRALKKPQVQAALKSEIERLKLYGEFVGTKRLIHLADRAKSEYVQADASKALMSSGKGSGGGAGGGVQISINLGQVTRADGQIVDVTPQDVVIQTTPDDSEV